MNEIEERAWEKYPKLEIPISGEGLVDINEEYRGLYIEIATEQKAIDIELIPQIYVHWLMIDGDKPSWNEYATKAMK